MAWARPRGSPGAHDRHRAQRCQEFACTWPVPRSSIFFGGEKKGKVPFRKTARSPREVANHICCLFWLAISFLPLEVLLSLSFLDPCVAQCNWGQSVLSYSSPPNLLCPRRWKVVRLFCLLALARRILALGSADSPPFGLCFTISRSWLSSILTLGSADSP